MALALRRSGVLLAHSFLLLPLVPVSLVLGKRSKVFPESENLDNILCIPPTEQAYPLSHGRIQKPVKLTQAYLCKCALRTENVNALALSSGKANII